MRTLWIVAVVLLGLAVASFAFMGNVFAAAPGHGMGGAGRMGYGTPGGLGGPWMGFGANISNISRNVTNMTTKDRASLLAAQSTDDYATATAILQKYGRAAPDRATFDLQAQITQAIASKNWMGAVNLQQQLGQLTQQKMDAQRTAMQARMKSMRTPAPANGVLNMGHRSGGFGFGHGRSNQTNSTNQTASS